MPTMLNALARLLPRSGPIPAVLNAARHAMKPEEKASRTGPLIALETLGRPVWTPRDYHSFAREGFQQNAIVYRAVRLISEAAASVPWLLYEDESDLSDHPLLDLLAQPSPDQTTTDFLEAWYGYLLVSGNAYVEAVGLNGKLRELHALRPDRMKVIPGEDGWPEAYEYTAAGQSIVFEDEPVHGVRPILHVKLFHPANDHYGMSPIEAASVAIDTHNTAAQWNKALLDNSARPSGALVYGGMDGRMTQDQFDRLKSELETTYQGAAHAGRPLLLEGGLDWKPLSLSPKDMDYYEARNSAAREIALALGVPPMLLGIPGDNTYANYQEAQRALWRNTVLPLVNRTAKAFTGWLTPAYADNLVFKPDLDQVEALTIEREALWARIDGVSFLTPNEKREAVGYAALEEFEPAPPVATPEPASTAFDFDPPTDFDDDNPFEVDDTKWLSKTSARECTAPVAVWATEGARKERTAPVAVWATEGATKISGARRPGASAAPAERPRAREPDKNTKRFDPNQPRAPAGSSTGGQWIDGASGGSAGTSTSNPTNRRKKPDSAEGDSASEVPNKDRTQTEDDDHSTLRDAIDNEGLDLDALDAPDDDREQVAGRLKPFLDAARKLLNVTKSRGSPSNILSKRRSPGKLRGKVEDLTDDERKIAEKLRQLGNDIEIVPRSTRRTPDFLVNGVPHELKTISNIKKTHIEGISASITRRILEGRGQAKDILIDATKQPGMSAEIVERTVKRAFGKDRIKKGINSITFFTKDGATHFPRTK